MRKKLALLFAVLLGASGIVSTTANAISLNIEVGDRPYYLHGPGYWSGGVYYVWVPGHWGRHRRAKSLPNEYFLLAEYLCPRILALQQPSQTNEDSQTRCEDDTC